MTIGENIKRLRNAKGMTQKDLAEACFITPQALSRWENGTAEPGTSSLKRLAEIFGVSVDELITGEKRVVIKEEKETKAEIAPETKVIVPLATCEKCGTFIYNADEVHRYVTKKRIKTGVHRHTTEEETHVLCTSCDEKRKQEKIREEKIRIARAKQRGRKFRIWNYVGGLLFGGAFGSLMASLFLYSDNISLMAGVGIAFGLLGYFAMASFILGNNFLSELAMDMIHFGFKLPFGVIFDSIVDLIVFKIVLFLIGIAVTILSICLAAIVCGILGVFTYPFALRKAYKYPETCWPK